MKSSVVLFALEPQPLHHFRETLACGCALPQPSLSSFGLWEGVVSVPAARASVLPSRRQLEPPLVRRIRLHLLAPHTPHLLLGGGREAKTIKTIANATTAF